MQLAGQQGPNGGGEDHGRVKTSEQELKMVGKLVQVSERGRIGERKKMEMREEGREGRSRRGRGGKGEGKEQRKGGGEGRRVM